MDKSEELKRRQERAEGTKGDMEPPANAEQYSKLKTDADALLKYGAGTLTDRDAFPLDQMITMLDDLEEAIAKFDPPAEGLWRKIADMATAFARGILAGTTTEVPDWMESPVKKKRNAGAGKSFYDLRPAIKYGRLAIPSRKGYSAALTGYKDEKGFIEPLSDPDFFKNNEIIGGNIVRVDGQMMRLEDVATKKEIALKDYDAPLLYGMFSIFYYAMRDGWFDTHDNVTIKKSQLSQFFNVRLAGENTYPLSAKLWQFNTFAGTIPGKGKMPLMAVIMEDDETVEVASAFLRNFVRGLQGPLTIEHNTKGRTKAHKTSPHADFLWKSSTVSERQKLAFLVGREITALLFKAPNSPHIKFKTIIERVPQLAAQIDAQERAKDKNIVLRRAFSKAYELIRTKSDAYDYWIELEIDPFIPTTSRLDECLKIKHKGIRAKDT